MRLSKDLFPFEVGGGGLGAVNFRFRTGQHILVDQQEVGVFAFFDAASLLLDEHLTGAVDGQGGESLLAGDEFFSPVGYALMAVGIERLDKSGAGLHSAVHRRRRWGEVIPGAKALPRRSSR